MSDPLHIVCPTCDAVNRVPGERLNDISRCGRCREPLFSGGPVEVDAESLERHIERNDLPVVVDFWAPWCAPCRSFAPTYAAAAERLEPRLRFLKLDTQSAPEAGARHGIRSIPTLAVFRGGREVARQAGALDPSSLQRWLQQWV